jgi:2-dehydro-3-deoxyphosphogluconate aldolase/(4S)-4-hydroxy-2-oxoglutarate aldolase
VSSESTVMWDVLTRHRVVPVIVADDHEVAGPLAEALSAAGLPLAEVTFRTPAAEQVLRRMAADPAMVVGAGTVLTPDQVDRAVDAGARFIVSPGISRAVVARAVELDVPVLPGVATPSDLMVAVELGLSWVKFFPAGTLGGTSALKALSAPFPGMRFVPTGGITPDTMPDYLALPAVAAVGGTWIAPPGLLAQHEFSLIRQLAAAAVAIAAGAA